MSLPSINRDLLKFARAAVTKRAFVPSDGVAGMGGGGAPPGGAPPGGGGPPPGPPPGGDPGAGAGMPAAPPGGGMGGGMPPGGGMGGPSGGEIDAKIQNAVRQALQTAGPGAGGGAGGAGGKPAKVDINTVAMDLFQLKKMMLSDFRRRGVELPPDVLDGPNRDPQTGLPAANPMGGSDPSGGGAPPGGGGAPPGGPGGPGGAIPPIPPMEPAMPPGGAGGPGGGKTAGVRLPRPLAFAALPRVEQEVELVKTAADVLRLYALYRERQALEADLDGGLDKLAAEFNAPEPALEAATASDTAIYGNPAGPGTPVSAGPAVAVRSKAAAVAAMFGARRKRR